MGRTGEKAGQGMDGPEIECQGHRWTVYWLADGDEPRCFMTNGVDHAEIGNAHEWEDLYAEAGRVIGDEETACDLACERLKRLLMKRGEWAPISGPPEWRVP